MTEDEELKALASMQDALEGVDDEARKRILAYLVSRHGVSPEILGKRPAGTAPIEQDLEFPDLATMFNAANPQTDSAKALVAGYWFHTEEKQADLNAQTINTALKNLGNGITNITSAMDALMKGKPKLVMQVQKKGTTKQARKRYRLTAAGLQAVRRMLAGEGLDEE